jgi:ATP-binding cassette subfamily B protein RaxB
LLSELAIGFALLIVLQGALDAERNWFVVALSMSLNFQWLGNVVVHPLNGLWPSSRSVHILSSVGSISTISENSTSGSCRHWLMAWVVGLLPRSFC